MGEGRTLSRLVVLLSGIKYDHPSDSWKVTLLFVFTFYMLGRQRDSVPLHVARSPAKKQIGTAFSRASSVFRVDAFVSFDNVAARR